MTEKTPAPATLDDQVCFALYSASRAVTAAYRVVLAEHDLTYPQYLVVLALLEQDGQTVSDLGHRLMLDSGTLSPLLRRLEASGRVERRRSSSDGRSVSIHLTAAGRELRPAIARIQRHLVGCLDLTHEEVVQLRALSRRVAARTPSEQVGSTDPAPTSKEIR